MANPNPARKKRRWWKAVLGLVLLVVALVAALPWLLSTPPARKWILEQANRELAPGGLEVGSFRFSWFGPTRLTGVALIDPQGDRVVQAPRAIWDRRFGQLLFDYPRFGTLTLEGARSDIERLPDGSIDLVEALRPILGKTPKKDLTIRASGAAVRFRSPELARPVIAHQANVILRLPPIPQPIEWDIRLVNVDPPRSSSLDLSGQFDTWGHARDLTLDIEAQRWPLAVTAGGVVVSGRLTGTLEANHLGGRWATSGHFALLRLDASGPLLAGDRLQLDRLGGAWDLAQTASGWSIQRLDLSSPLATLKATGPMPPPPGTATRIEGNLDLAALAHQLPHALRLREGSNLEQGSARLRVEARTEPAGQSWDARAEVSDLVARLGDRTLTLADPATLTALLSGSAGDLRVEQVGVETPFLKAEGRGDLDRGLEITGSIDLAGVRRQLGDLIEFGNLELAGQGPLTGHYRREGTGYSGRLAADLEGLKVAGLTSEPIEREALHLEATVSGPASASGLPRDWQGAGLSAISGESRGELALAHRDENAELIARASVPIRLSSDAEPFPVALGLKGTYQPRPGPDRFEVADLALSAPYAALRASGHLDDLFGKQEIELQGVVEPNWKAVNDWIDQRIEPGASVEGRARPFRVSGSLAGDPSGTVWERLEAEGGLDLIAANIYGMQLGPAPLVAHWRGGRLEFDPIETTLNGGRLRLEPEFLRDEHLGMMIRLGPGTTIENAEINDEVSRRVLAFVAPILDQATRAHGRVSARIERAEFPLSDDPAHRAVVEGQLVFQDVEFAPGPLPAALLDLIGRPIQPMIQIDEPVVLSIADGRIYQHGLAIPVAGLTRIEVEGWVDFDRNLDLKASLPLTPTMLADVPLVQDLIGDARVTVPIRGKLSLPKLDLDTFQANLKAMGENLLTNGAVRGAAGILMRLTQPRDPNAPPRPSAAERRALRRERREERRNQP